MPEIQLKSILEAIRGDAALCEKLKEANSYEEIADILRIAGFDSIQPDFLSANNEIPALLGDSELELVAGGWQPGDCVKTADPSNAAGPMCSAQKAFC